MSFSHDATFDAGPPSPSPASRTSLGGELAFKPPSRPGSSLRRGVRKSAADLGANASAASPPPPLPRSSTAQQLGNGPLGSADQNALSRTSSHSSMSEDSELEASGTAMAPPESPTKPRSSFLRSSLGAGAASGTPGRGEMGPPPVPTPRQTDRRARNAAAPAGNGDASLVNELQENLVKEIRRLQGLLLERDGEIRNLREAKEETEKELGSWKPRALALIQAEGEWPTRACSAALRAYCGGAQTSSSRRTGT
jgi:hypothetical protein